MDWYTMHSGGFWGMHSGWWIFWLAMLLLVWFNRDSLGSGTQGRGRVVSRTTRRRLAWLVPAFVAGLGSCGITPPPAPVPVQGTQEEVKALSGEWVGRYWLYHPARPAPI